MDKRKILIVDDGLAAPGLEEQLTELGFEVDVIAASEDKADAARALQQLEDSFFETSIDMLCCLDFNMHFRRLSPAWECTLGFSREELMGRPFIEFVHPDDRERTLKQNAEVRSGTQALSFENRYQCKDGSFRWLRWNAAPHSTQKVIYPECKERT